MTTPDPHGSSPVHAAQTRRALREARERAEAAADAVDAVDSEATAQTENTSPTRASRRRQSRSTHPARSGRRITARIAVAAASAVVIVGSAAGALALNSTPGTTSQGAHDGDVINSQIAPSATEHVEPSPHTPPVAGRPTSAGIAGGATAADQASVTLCDTPAVTKALDAHDDVAAIRAAGGAAQFRAAVATGQAPCVSLTDPARLWVVINKQRPLHPLDYAPAPRKLPDHVRSVEGGTLRSDAADALTRMVRAAAKAGVGEIALQSGYRSFTTQQRSFGRQVDMRGTQEAERVSARPGYSEHQSGLTGDLVSCRQGRCGTLDDLAGSAQGAWLRAHAWEYGWIVRYEKGQTATSGYSPEPWHLRYIGTDLAALYHDGEFHTLEAFLGLPAAPDYKD